jgi:hypothetical protein
MNPHYLLKEEIEYELHARGLSVSADVSLLHKVFRSVSTEAVAVNLESLGGEIKPQEHIEYILSKIQDLEVLVEKSTTELAAIGPRFHARPTFCWLFNNIVELGYAS